MSLLTTIKLSAARPPAGYMKALTVYQPHAFALIDGTKEYETRGFSIKYRGLLAIHAGAKRMRTRGLEYPANRFHEEFIVYSAILGIVEVIDSIPVAKINPSPQELDLGNFSPGRFGWRMRVVKQFAEPIPYKGAQGLWHLPLSALGDNDLPGAAEAHTTNGGNAP